MRRSSRPGIAAIVSCLSLLAGIAGSAATATAAGSAGVSISPAAATTPSGAAVKFTLTVSCSVTGGCNGTTVTFPSTTITGDGSTADFGPWVGNSTCTSVTRKASGGQVTFTYGAVPTGTMLCDFPVAPPEYTTFDNTQVTLTPTISGTNFSSSTGSPATLTVTAGHTDSLAKGAPGTVTSGLPFQYSLVFYCGGGSYTGDIGLSAVTITDTFPANFTYSSYDTGGKKLPGTFTYDASSSTLTYSDPSGTTCGNTSLYTPQGNVGNQVLITVSGTAAANGVADPAGTKICNSARAAFTYLDGFSATSSPPAACSRRRRLRP